MKTLLKNGTVLNVFTGKLTDENVLIDGEKIAFVGKTQPYADNIEDITGKTVCPAFTDGHIHIESTMLTPFELAKALLPHGTASIIADPHEIANVCGKNGIDYMLKASENIPLNVYIMLPSCVPATKFDESGAELEAEDLREYYKNPRVLGLAEVMNYVGVINGDEDVISKIRDAQKYGKAVDGHAPLLSGEDLDKYIAAGIESDHECSNIHEAMEKLKKGMYIMIRQGTAARNLEGLIDLFDEPLCRRCILVTDDRHPADIINDGHIDSIIRNAVKMGKSAVTAIQMATIQAAQYFGLRHVGAVASGYRADLLVLNDLNSVDIKDVYFGGRKVVSNKKTIDFEEPKLPKELLKAVCSSFHIEKVSFEDFYIKPLSEKCRVIKTVPSQLITEEKIMDINWNENNGIDIKRDILKLAVIERHKNTGHKTVGFISGIGLKEGAVASSVSHDSHNIVVIGTNDEDMAAAVNHIIEIGGGCAAVCRGKIKADMPLPVAGLMSLMSAEETAEKNAVFIRALEEMGACKQLAPLMVMAFVCLPVIPEIKMTPKGLIDVKKQEKVSLYV